MAWQCNVCVGTGKCRTCRGKGEAEGSEPQSFRATRRDRLYSPAPQLCGVWRYRTLALAKSPVKPLTGGETLTKDDVVPTYPECAEEKTWPCSSECWRPCDKCHKLVCEKHDYRVPVWPPENGGCDPADMICKECLAALWYRGDISQGTRVQYLY
jgi:hypothetical protein